MKKIGIITINDFGNYGNRLQCYAVQHYLESMGYSVENIYNTYRRSGFIVNSIKKVIQLLKYFSVRKNIDVYLVKNNEQIKISESAHYAYILEFGIKDALRKVTSIFEKSHNEILASSFLIACGYAEELEDAFDKIDQNGYNMNKDCDTSDIIVMSWVIRLYSAVKLRRIVAIKTIKKCLALTASQLEKREMNNLIKCLERIDDSSLLE